MAESTNCLSENGPTRGGQAHFAPRAPQNEPVPARSRIGTNSLANPAANQHQRRKLSSIGIAGAVVALLILCEVGLLYCYFTAGEFSSKTAVQNAAADDYSPVRDVDLGQFSLAAMDSNSGGMLLIEFHLLGSVDASHPEQDAEGGGARDGIARTKSASSGVAAVDQASFEKLFRREKSHFRDQVIVIVGRAQISALSDPDFGVIKAQALGQNELLAG